MVNAPSNIASEPASRPALAAAAIAGATTCFYVGIILREGDVDASSVGAVVVALGALTGAAAVGATRPSVSRRLPWLGASTGGLFGLGVVSLLSIGLPLLIAGLLASLAWVRASTAAGPGHRRERACAAALAVLTPVVSLGVILAT